MLVNGRELAEEVFHTVAQRVATCGFVPHLAIITCAPTFSTQTYIALKKARADKLGIALTIIELPPLSSTADLIAAVQEAVTTHHGVVVQLPLPASIDTAAVLKSVPASHDVDALAANDTVLSPVAAAIDHISSEYGVLWTGARVVIFGQGRLVGGPVASYAREHGAAVTVVTEDNPADAQAAADADIVVLGVGKPALLTADMVRDGVVVFDAGASEDGGVLRGDAAESVAQKASLLTPVPGGIGPLTLAFLFSNLLDLATRQVR